MDLPRDLCLALLDRAHRACLHRLRGTVQVLGGWATLGLPAHEPDETLRRRMVEVQEITEWLDTLWHLLQDSPTDLSHPQLPSWLIAATLRAGTPQEAKSPLPEIADGQAGLALSAWAETVAGHSTSPQFVLRMTDDNRLLCRVQGADLRQASAELMVQLKPWLSQEQLAEDEIGFGAGVLCRGLRLNSGEENRAYPTPA